MILKIYFRHRLGPHPTRLVSLGGVGPELPELTYLRIEIDPDQNPPEASTLRIRTLRTRLQRNDGARRASNYGRLIPISRFFLS